MEKIKKLSKYIDKFTTAVAVISFVMVAFMVLLNVGDVVMNKFFNKPIIGAYELTQRALMCAVFTSFAYGQTQKSHINMTLIVAVLPRFLRFFIFTAMSILSVVAAGAMTYASFIQAGVAVDMGYMTEVLYIPLYPFYYIQTIAMAIFTLALLYDTVLSACAIFSDEMAEYIQANWS